MEEININYAYDGFLYAPMFLAEALGVFQKRMRPRYRTGDEPTVNKLRTPVDPEDHGRNWFAICDPFAKDITAVQKAIGPRDHVCIVASFIHRLPVWLYYNGDAEFGICSDESGLSQRRADVDYLRCYKRFNTGFLVGDRVRTQLVLSEDKLIERDFGNEFGNASDVLAPKTLVVTSDVLRLIKDNAFDSGSVVFSYAQRVPDLNPFLFTAVLTLKSVIDKQLDAVLSLLSGLRLAAQHLNEASNIQELSRHYAGFSIHDVRRAVDVLREEEIYSTDFDLDEAASAYEKARNAWQTLKPSVQFADIEKCREPIPCLLLKNGWHTDRILVDLFVKKWKGDPNLVEILAKGLPERPINPFKHKYHALLGVVLTLLAFLGGLLLVDGWKKISEDNLLYWFIAAVLFLTQLVCSAVLSWNVVKKFELKGWEFLAATIFAAFGLLITTVTGFVR